MIIHHISLLVLTTVQPREERGWNNRRTMVAAQESFTLIGGEQLVTMQCAVMAVVCNITVGNSVTMACNSAVGNTTVEPSERASRSTVAAAAQENWGLLSSHQTPAASTLLTVTIGPVALRQWHRHQVQHQVQHQHFWHKFHQYQHTWLLLLDECWWDSRCSTNIHPRVAAAKTSDPWKEWLKRQKRFRNGQSLQVPAFRCSFWP